MNLDIKYINRLLEYEKVENGLYIIATPIGNLGDITIRSLKTLSSVDLIICEDTRVSKKLTNKYGIKTTLKPFHKFNSKKMIPGIISKLQNNSSIALISDSGTPVISDPGSDLIFECHRHKINIFSLPGPSSPIASFILSNFAETSFTFRGFFPRQKKNILSEINFLKSTSSPVIYFESPKRINKTLKLILSDYGNCNISFVRELTKKNEEVLNLKIENLIYILEQRTKILGEITFIIEPLVKNHKNEISQKTILKMASKLKSNGFSISETSKIIAKDLKISKREIYQLLIKK